MRFWLCLSIYMILDTCGSWTTARWVHADGRRWCYLAFIAYVGCSVVWLAGLGGEKNPGVARASAIYPVIAMLTGIGAGYAVGEHLGPKAWLGALLGVIAIALVTSDIS